MDELNIHTIPKAFGFIMKMCTANTLFKNLGMRTRNFNGYTYTINLGNTLTYVLKYKAFYS